MVTVTKNKNEVGSASFDLLASAALAVALVPLFLARDIKLALAVPLSLLIGLISRHLFQLILSPSSHDVFSPTTLAAGYFASYFALRSFYLGSVPFLARIGRNPYDDYLPAALWCASMGYASFLSGMRTSMARRLLTPWQARIQKWPRSLPTARIVVLMLMGLACLLYLFKIGVAVGNYGNLEFQRHPPPGIVVLLEGLIELSWVALCLFLVTASKRSKRGTTWMLVGVCAGILCIKLGISGGKVALIQPLLQAAIVFHYGKRRFRIWEIVAFGIPVIIMAFGVVNFYRFVVVGHLGSPKSLSDVISRVSSTSDLLSSQHAAAAQRPALEQMVDRDAGVDALALIMKYTPHPFSYVYGMHWLEVPLTFVPRQLWKDKPINMPSAEFEITYLGEPYSYNGFSSMHLIADLYRNFSYPGVLLGMFICGTLVRWFYFLCAPSRANCAGVFLYAALFPEIIHSFEADVGYALINISRAAALALGTVMFLRMQNQRPRCLGALDSGPPTPWRIDALQGQ